MAAIEVVFRNLDASPVVAARLEREAAALERKFRRIEKVRIVVERPSRRHRHGTPYHVRINIAVPGEDIVVAHDPAPRDPDLSTFRKASEPEALHRELDVTIREAFDAARRRLDEYARKLRADTKTRASAGRRRAG
ncbi:MAG: HPF/RaiA family ribosome-associated protein [Vicinamibacterales bacterium]